jgi:hypothetical protein
VLVALAAAVPLGCGGGDGLRVEVDESSPLDTGAGAAWVQREGRVARVDRDGRVTPGPASPALGGWDVDGDALWVAGRDAVRRYDTRTLRAAGPAGNGVGGATEVLARGAVVWARSGGTVRRIDAGSGRVKGRPVDLKGGVVDDWAADGDALYAVSSRPANLSSDHWVTRVDARTGRVVTRSIQPRNGVFYSQLAVGAGRVWIAQSRVGYEVGRSYRRRTATVTRHDPRTLAPAGAPVAVDPSPFAVDIFGDTAWVSDLDGGLARIPARPDGGDARRSSFGNSPPVLAAGRGVVYAHVGEGRVRLLDPETLRGRDERRVDEHLGEMRLDGDVVWLLNTPTQDPEVDDEPPWTLTRMKP